MTRHFSTDQLPCCDYLLVELRILRAVYRRIFLTYNNMVGVPGTLGSLDVVERR